jgi:hypothetical protein
MKKTTILWTASLLLLSFLYTIIFDPDKKEKKIEKPWCTYGLGFSLYGYGKIVSESEHSVDILYSEGQHYSPECWDKKECYVKRYDTLEEAAEKYFYYHNHGTDLRMDHPYGKEEMKSQIRYKFPSYFKGKEKKSEANKTVLRNRK